MDSLNIAEDTLDSLVDLDSLDTVEDTLDSLVDLDSLDSLDSVGLRFAVFWVHWI